MFSLFLFVGVLVAGFFFATSRGLSGFWALLPLGTGWIAGFIGVNAFLAMGGHMGSARAAHAIIYVVGAVVGLAIVSSMEPASFRDGRLNLR